MKLIEKRHWTSIKRKQQNDFMRKFGFIATGAILYGATILTPAMAADAKAGEAVFAARCQVCHGPDGEGKPAIAKMLNITFKPMGAPEIQEKSDAELKTIITTGFGKMKAVTGLSPTDLDNVVAYIRTFKK